MKKICFACGLSALLLGCVAAIDDLVYTCSDNSDCPKNQKCAEVDYEDICVDADWCNDDGYCGNCDADGNCPDGQECITKTTGGEICVFAGRCDDDDDCSVGEECDRSTHTCVTEPYCSGYTPTYGEESECCRESNPCSWDYDDACDCDGMCSWDSFDCRYD